MTKAIPYEPKLFEASDETDLDYMQVNISGLPGSSKTFTALTISDQWGGWPAKSLTYLEDIIHIGHDRTPLIGLLQHNYRVRYKIDIQKIMGQKGWTVEDAINAALDESYEICDKVGGIKAYIDDTVSSLDFALQGHFFSTIETDNTVLLYGKIGAAHQQYKSAVNGLGVMPIALFHLRTLAPDIAKKTEDKKRTEAAKMLIQGDQGAMLIPEISGKAARYYFGAGSVELVCRSYRSPQSGDW